MNRSSKGFGLIGVFATVLILVITAVLSTSANSAEMPIQPQSVQSK